MTKTERHHFYNPAAIVTGDAPHLFGIPRLCGYEWNDNGTHFHVAGGNRGDRDRALFKYTISGQGVLILNGKEHILNAGDGFFLAGNVSDTHYDYRISDNADHWEFLFISFDKTVAIDIVRRIIRDAGNIVRLNPAGAAVKSAWHLYEMFRSGEVADPYAASRLGYDLLMQLCSEAVTFSGKAAGTDLVHKIAAYGFRHLDRPVTVDELAAKCNYSRWYFSKIFRAAAGMSPSEFIMEQKLTAAVQIIQHENLPVKELAARCGFTDPGYFIRRFKRRYGITPAQYKSQEES